jgi:hypothetical protein
VDYFWKERENISGNVDLKILIASLLQRHASLIVWELGAKKMAMV